jgi:hypothetical protein
MDCKNLDLNEIIRKSELCDRLLEQIEDDKKKLSKLTEFFAEKTINGVNFNYYRDWHIELIHTVEKLTDENYQAFELAKERKSYNEEFSNQMKMFEQEMDYKRKELIEAWEKFRAITTKKYQQTLQEINEENI